MCTYVCSSNNKLRIFPTSVNHSFFEHVAWQTGHILASTTIIHNPLLLNTISLDQYWKNINREMLKPKSKAIRF